MAEGSEGHLALTAAPTSPHTPLLLLWQKGLLLAVVGRGKCHMGLWLGGWRDIQYSRDEGGDKAKYAGENLYILPTSLPPLPDI